ncbi:MAG: energy transducer TonB [Psychrobium sp.]|nr:energy transducer TonB [Psychrobium sp.]
MSAFAGVQTDMARHPAWLWLTAIVAVLLLHIAVVSFFLWQPQSQPELFLSAAAAPVAFKVSMVAAPKAPATALPVGLLAQQSAPIFEQQIVQAATPASAQSEQVIKPLVNIESDVVLTAPSPKKVPDKKKEIEHTRLIQEQPMPKDTPAKAQPVDSLNENRDENADNQAKQYVAQSSAPSTQDTFESIVASAPDVGALNDVESKVKLSWKNKLQAHLERRKRYPRRAQMLGQEGVPWVRFTIDRAGNVLQVSLYRASGYAVLDKEVVALVLRAQPLPKPPEDVLGKQLTLAVPVAFYAR